MVDFLNNKKKRILDVDKKDPKNISKNTDDEQLSNVNVERYKDLDGITVKKLDWGLFYIEQRGNLISIRNGFLLFAAIMIWGVYFFIFGGYMIKGAAADKNLMHSIVAQDISSYDYLLNRSAKDLQIGKAQFIKLNDKYDFFMDIKNPNKDFWCEFEYFFTNDNLEIERKTAYILPNESKYLLSLDHEFTERVGVIKFNLENIKWRRVNPRKYGVWDDFYKKRMNIKITNEKFTASKASPDSKKVPLNDLVFTIDNNTAYNYRDMDFIIFLYSGSKIVGVNKYIIGSFISGEERNINMTWPGNLQNVSSVKIIPEKKITDNDIYLRFEGDKGTIVQ